MLRTRPLLRPAFIKKVLFGLFIESVVGSVLGLVPASVTPEVGAEVQAGEDVGTVGDTGSLKGSYLYFEIRKGGLAVDPAPWFTRGS